jgi:enamine deaminase RidA (YjgF/YER057c/UK114 family)
MFRTSSKAGQLVLLAGIVGRDANGQLVAGIVGQTEFALQRIEAVLAEHNLKRDAIGRIRVYLTRLSDWEEVKQILEHFFAGDWPPAVVIVVSALVDPAMKVEIEVDAIATE